MLNLEEIVVDVCPECRYARCLALFGNAWFRPPQIDSEAPRCDQLCPHCDSQMPLVKRLELGRGKMQLELFAVRRPEARPAPDSAPGGLLEAFRNHTPANFLRKHHAYYGMTREEVEQYISDHQIP